MAVQLNFPGIDDQLFWFFFNFGLGSAGGSSFVGLCYFFVFVRLHSPRWAANATGIPLFAFFMCIIFTLSSIDRALNVSHIELSALSTFGLIFGLALPITAAYFLHNGEVNFRFPDAKSGGR